MPARSRPTTVYPIAIREVEVARTVDLTPGLRRITLTGTQLQSFTDAQQRTWPAFTSTGFDDDIRLIFPYPGEQEPVMPILHDGGIKLPEGRRPIWRVYTVRRYDPVSGELDVEFVKHGVGIATTWAYRAKQGDRVHIAGPSVSRGLPTDMDQLLLVGDETALPAIARLLEEAPEGLRADVLIEIARSEHRLELKEHPGVRTTWLVRDADAESCSLIDAVRQATEAPGWRGETTTAWLAGEQSVVRELRRLLLAAGVDKRQIDFTGYWKRGEVATLETDPEVTDEARNEDAFATFHDQAEILPSLAIRVAATIGLGELIAEGIDDPDRLARRTATDARALGKLLRYLAAIGLLEGRRDNGGTPHYSLTHTGHYLTEELALEVLHRDGVYARQALALFGLEHSVRTGQAAYATVTGREYADLRADPDYASRLLEQTAQYADYVVAPLIEASALHDIRHLVIHADAAVPAAAAIIDRHPDTSVTIITPPSDAAWTGAEMSRRIPDPRLRQRVEILVQTIAEPVPAADAILFGTVLAAFHDPEAVHILRRSAQYLSDDGRILLLEDTIHDTELDEHHAEADLLDLTLHGTGRRTDAELEAIIVAAGLRTATTETIGWGHTLRTLAPA
ncbi:hypothetical protein BHE97_04675 [Aeromicrobium sp. PE09-221]|uniref:siderophore-interacting protein n=1 Tax=Aeromicrobium sp. PE09-221 TaxID=1898043 RepID=UPI000B731E6B|nr:siderophore-interacting protein [Aeromicrobium sp. PE09-221]OUZ11152.1 hypothetical protein BHE97_04675 [Aeromicrobium sp. PE09-221]